MKKHRILFLYSLCLVAIIPVGAMQVKAQTLEDYQMRAERENPGVNAEHKAFEAAIESARESRVPDDPSLTVGYFVSPAGPQRVKLSMTQMLPWFGSFQTAGETADLAAQAQYQAWLDIGNESKYLAAIAWFDLHEWKELLAVEKRNRDLLETYKDITMMKFESGEEPMANVLRIDIRLKDTETQIEILKDRKRVLDARFNRVLGRPTETSVLLNDTLTYEPPALLAMPADSALAGNPRLKSLELLALSAERRSDMARKRGAPNFGIGFDYIFVDKKNNLDMPDNGKDMFMPMVTMSIPIFRGKYDAAISRAELESENYRLRKLDLQYELRTEYENLDYEMARTRSLIALYKRQIEETNRALELLLADYAGGSTKFEALLDLQENLFDFERARIAAIKDLYSAQAKLTYLTEGIQNEVERR